MTLGEGGMARPRRGGPRGRWPGRAGRRRGAGEDIVGTEKAGVVLIWSGGTEAPESDGFAMICINEQVSKAGLSVYDIAAVGGTPHSTLRRAGKEE